MQRVVMLGIAAAFVVIACAAAPGLAQTQRPQEKALTRPENWGITFGLGVLSGYYDPPGSQPYMYGTRGAGLNFSLGLVFVRNFLMGGEIGSIGFRGDRELLSLGLPYQSETTNSLSGSFYVGVITSPMGKSPRMGRKWWAGALLGESKWSGERRLEGCTGCSTDRITMVSGPFVEPFFVFGGGDKDGGGGIRLGYRQYLAKSRTMQSAISLGVFFDFIKL